MEIEGQPAVVSPGMKGEVGQSGRSLPTPLRLAVASAIAAGFGVWKVFFQKDA